ncbi:MAG: CoA transferase [Dehalococcoidia bacterium]|nr:CoA transferase [Dehalococcoidia bacterium]
MMFALENTLVLDLTHTGPGDVCTMMLGDLGSEVIKIQAIPDVSPKGRASYIDDDLKNHVFNPLNRNKKSLGLNLRAEEARAIMYRLCERADVVVEGFRPGTVKRLGVDYETVAAINPRIIYCSLSGYGQSGPYAGLPGHDVNYTGMSGVLGLIGNRTGPPVIPLNLLGDFAGAALHGVIGILAALAARHTIGKGQYVDIAYLDTTISLLSFFGTRYFASGTILRRGETALHGAYPYYGVYETRDGKYISIGCLESRFWEVLCGALELEHLAEHHFQPDHFFMGSENPLWEEVRGELQRVFLTRTRDEWFEFLAPYDIPVGKVYAMDEVFGDPQVRHREMTVELEHELLGKVVQIGSPIKLSETPACARRLAPTFGQHTREVLKELDYPDSEIERFYEERVIG